MKATELQINDLVLDQYGNVTRVTSMSEKMIVTEKDGPVTLSHPEQVQPIPLTEEILVKNGWRKHTMLYKNEWYGDIGLFEEHGKFYYMDIKIEYVHQLQHLLRLCGIEKELTI